MKRKFILLIGLAAVAITGCGKSSGDSDITAKSNGIVKYSEEADIPQTDAGEKPETYKDEIKTVFEANKKDMDTEVECEHVSYKIERVEITKKIGDHKKEAINFWNEQTNDNGDLTGDEQYIWITIKAKNYGDDDQNILLNNLIVSINSENVVQETAAEARYIMPEQNDMGPEKRFHCLLATGEEKEFEIGYIIEEENAPDALYYCLGDGGSTLDDPNNTFVYLGKLSDE